MLRASPKFVGFVVLAVALVTAAPGNANVVVTYTTTPHGGTFAPKNVVVAWVEDAAGNFVKTIDRWSATRTSHLVAWIAKAGNGDADAVSGATRPDHTQTLTANWDFKNKAGQVVPDGTYTIRMELADSNSSTPAQNDQGTYTFTKSATASKQSNVKSGGFTTTIDYTPNASPTCNNGVIDPGETCDPPGTCPTSCADSGDACMPNVLVGTAAGCTAQCVPQAVTACSNGDGCCPAGCTPANDSDCTAGSSGGGNLSGGCDTGGNAPLLLGLTLVGLLVWRRRE